MRMLHETESRIIVSSPGREIIGAYELHGVSAREPLHKEFCCSSVHGYYGKRTLTFIQTFRAGCKDLQGLDSRGKGPVADTFGFCFPPVAVYDVSVTWISKAIQFSQFSPTPAWIIIFPLTTMTRASQLSEDYIQDSFHSYLKSSLTQAKAERLLDADILSSAEGDLMITGTFSVHFSRATSD